MSTSNLDTIINQCIEALQTQTPAQVFSGILASVEHRPATWAGRVLSEYRRALNTKHGQQARGKQPKLQELYNLMYADLVRAIPDPFAPSGLTLVASNTNPVPAEPAVAAAPTSQPAASQPIAPQSDPPSDLQAPRE